MTQPLGHPKFRAFDANGDPLAGGLLYSYAAGTSTPLATYTTRAGSVANANPVVLDANGEADVWMTPGTLYKFELRNSTGVVQWTVDNYPSPADDSAATVDASVDPGGRLTLTSGTPVTTGDVTGATTIHYAPHKHSKVPLYDGSAWSLHDIGSGLSQTTTDTTKSPAAVAADTCYDVFIWLDNGTLRESRGPAWASDTSRGTGAGTSELERVDGRWVNKVSISNGPAAQRGLYVGTIRSDGSSQVNDSLAKRHVWNAYHRAPRAMRVLEATNTWQFAGTTMRQANSSTANQLDFVRGLDEDSVRARIVASARCNQNEYVVVAIGLDSTTTMATGCANAQVASANASTVDVSAVADYAGYPGLGRHRLTWLEKGSDAGGGGTGVVWYGDSNSVYLQSGISGEVWA